MNTNFKLLTINLEYCNKNPKEQKLKGKILSKNNPDIIFVQEGNNDLIQLNEYNYINNYLHPNSHNDEKMDIYIKKDSNWKILSNIKLYSTLSHEQRNYIILTIKNIYTSKIIKIANIHLCGGRFDENDKIGKMLLGNLKTVRKRKNEIINKLINNLDVDIIAGDFNSDLNCFLNNGIIDKNHLKYFKKISPNTSTNIFVEWNISPYYLLYKNKYELAFSNDKSKKNITSIFNNHPDSIWFKKNKMKLCYYDYIDFISYNLSDHNAIFTDFIIS